MNSQCTQGTFLMAVKTILKKEFTSTDSLPVIGTKSGIESGSGILFEEIFIL
jgi:hypothetical protein